MTFKPYEGYKKVGLPWIEKIPKHWELIRNKNILNVRDARVGSNHNQYKLLSLTKNGVIERDMENPQGKFPREFDNYKIVSNNDMIFCLFDIDETPRTVGHSRMDGMITGAYNIFSVKDINKKYFYYFYLNIDNGKMLKPLYTGLRKTVNLNTFLRTRTPFPPKEEQNKIVEFLDDKLEKTEKIIELKTRLIGLLKEQKEAMINKAVTKGLDDSVEMKDSGVEWLGKTPVDWSKNKINRVFKSIGSGTTPSSGNQEYYQDGNINWMNSGDLKSMYIFETKNKITEKALLDYSTLKIYPENTVVIAMYGATIGNLGIIQMEACMNQACCGLYNIEESSYLEYMYYVLLSARSYLIEKSRGGGQPNISQDIIKQTWIPVPSKKEQIEIARYIKEESKKIDETISLYQKEIDLVKEYKTSLISAVVTGKVDVRNM